MDDATRVRICGLVAGIIASDREMHPHEAAFLQRVRARFKLPKGQAVAPTVDRDEAVKALGELPAEQRASTLDLLVEAAAADGSIHDEERRLLVSLAASLELAEDELDKRIQEQLGAVSLQPFGPAAKQVDDI